MQAAKEKIVTIFHTSYSKIKRNNTCKNKRYTETRNATDVAKRIVGIVNSTAVTIKTFTDDDPTRKKTLIIQRMTTIPNHTTTWLSLPET